MEPDKRHLHVQRSLNCPVHFIAVDGADGPPLDRGILGINTYDPAVDGPVAGHNAVTGRIVKIADKHIKLDKTARVQKQIDSLPGIELAFRTLLGQLVFAAAQHGPVLALLKLVNSFFNKFFHKYTSGKILFSAP